jgi:hypothetical protein
VYSPAAADPALGLRVRHLYTVLVEPGEELRAGQPVDVRSESVWAGICERPDRRVRPVCPARGFVSAGRDSIAVPMVPRQGAPAPGALPCNPCILVCEVSACEADKTPSRSSVPVVIAVNTPPPSGR